MIVEVIKPRKDLIIEVKSDAQYVLDLSGEAQSDASIDFVFMQPGVCAEVLAPFVVTAKAPINLITSSTHLVPSTSCDVQIRRVLSDGAAASYVGKIIIDKKAQQTSSFLHDATLVTGTHTKNRSEPILKIDANDVKASHGATTGRVDDLSLYYLKSRGLSTAEAQKIVLEGFFEAIITKIADPDVQEYFRERLNK